MKGNKDLKRVGLPFEGINVLGFTWAGVGPMLEMVLAQFGATVVKVENEKRPDILRSSGPYKDGIPGVDRTGYFATINSNKYSVNLDMNNPGVNEVASKLVRWADVIVDNFAPGVIEKWNLGYEEVRKINPGIIMCRSSNQGLTGPHSKLPGFGLQLEALTGFSYLSGWPDRHPVTTDAYNDVISPFCAVSYIVAALLNRDRTGEGVLIDLSQYEVGINFLGTCFMDYFANGREWKRMGNSHPYYAPYGVFKCRGDDRWCTITVSTTEEWNGFCSALGNPPWTGDPKFSTASVRKENEEELNRLIEDWTMNLTPEQVMMILQAENVSAGVVQTMEDMSSDPQQKLRGALATVKHPVIGDYPHAVVSIQMNETPPEVKMPAPCLGEHTLLVLSEFLGLSDAEIDKLVVEGVI